jgi:hypothetical protein
VKFIIQKSNKAQISLILNCLMVLICICFVLIFLTQEKGDIKTVFIIQFSMMVIVYSYAITLNKSISKMEIQIKELMDISKASLAQDKQNS